MTKGVNLDGVTVEEKAVTVNHKNFLNKKKSYEFYCKETKALERLSDLIKSSQLMVQID